MRAIDGELPQFDHCLNALLLVAYVALRQGDHIAVQSFGGEDRWLPPVKGSHAMATVLNHLYDATTSSAPSDFAEAAERLARLLLAVREEQEQPELEPKLLLSQAKMEETPEQQLRLLV